MKSNEATHGRDSRGGTVACSNNNNEAQGYIRMHVVFRTNTSAQDQSNYRATMVRGSRGCGCCRLDTDKGHRTGPMTTTGVDSSSTLLRPTAYFTADEESCNVHGYNSAPPGHISGRQDGSLTRGAVIFPEIFSFFSP